MPTVPSLIGELEQTIANKKAVPPKPKSTPKDPPKPPTAQATVPMKQASLESKVPEPVIVLPPMPSEDAGKKKVTPAQRLLPVAPTKNLTLNSRLS